MKYFELMREIGRGTIKAAYLFSGPEDYLKETAQRRIKKILLEPEFSQFNYDLFFGDKIDGRELLNKLLTQPVGAGRRLVVIKAAQRLQPSVKEAIMEYLKNPSPTSCLVLWVPRVDLRKKFYLAVEKAGRSVLFYPLWDKELTDWIREYLLRSRKKIASAASNLLVERVGKNLGTLVPELDKLLIHLGQRDQITTEDVENLIGKVRSRTIFELTDAIGRKRAKEALAILTRMMDEGTSGTEILYMIVRQFRFLLRTKVLFEKKLAEAKIAQVLLLRPFAVKKLLLQAKNFSLKKLIKNFEDLLQAEVEIKSGKRTPKMILELLILRLCRE
jgi:DNA polymerase-3 subunit delta